MSDLLIRVIRRHGLTGTPDEVTIALNARTIEKHDDTRKTLADLASRFGRTQLVEVADKVKAAGCSLFLDMLTSGISFTHPETIGALDDLVMSGALTAEQAAAFKEVGVWLESIWQDSGGEGEALVSDVTAALAQIATEDNAEELKQHAQARLDAIKIKLDSGDITDWPGCVGEFEAE